MTELLQSGTSQPNGVNSNEDEQPNHTVLSVIFGSSYLKEDVQLLRKCRLVSKSWNIHASKCLQACKMVTLVEGNPKLRKLLRLLFKTELGLFPNLTTPFGNFCAFAQSFTDPIFIQILRIYPITNLGIVLSNDNETNFNFSQCSRVLRKNQRNIVNLMFSTDNTGFQWGEDEEALINDVELTSLKVLKLQEINERSHSQFAKTILSICNPECIYLQSQDGNAVANLLSQDRAENLNYFNLKTSPLSTKSWEHLENLRFPRITRLTVLASEPYSEWDFTNHATQWHSLLQNVSPFLEELKTNLPISSASSQLIFPNLDCVKIANNNVLSYFTSERFPSVITVVYVDEIESLTLQKDAIVPHLGVIHFQVELNRMNFENHSFHDKLMALLTYMGRQFPNVSSLSFSMSKFCCSALVDIFEAFPKLQYLRLNGGCDFFCFSGMTKSVVTMYAEGGWPIGRVPRQTSITDFKDLEKISLSQEFVLHPDMIEYCLPRVPNLREISFFWNDTLSVPLLRESIGHLERIDILIFTENKNKFKSVISQVGVVLSNTRVSYI